MPEDWRKAVSFSDRLNETTKIVSAYKTVHPNCEPSEASKYAKTTEEQARKSALSLQEYHDLCAKSIAQLLSAAKDEPVEDRHPNEHIYPNLPYEGAQLGRYSNAEHFQDGIFSEIYRARNPDFKPGTDTPKIVALKVTNPSMMTPPHDSQREARLLTKAKSDHTIPLIETFQQAGGSFVLVFPYMPYDLNMLLHKNELTAHSRRSILRDLFNGLQHIHNLGIIHRDIKPSNILLAGKSGPAYIADFGIAWSSNDAASEPADQKILDVGTTSYRPPELLFGYSSYTTKLDLWAAGCLAAQVVCLHGETLFDAGDLGSELALIKSMFQTLGTPDEKTWPEADNMPDWGKMNFVKYPAKAWEEILPEAEVQGRDLVRHLVQYESAWRLSAEEALKHPYLQADAASA